MKHWIIVLFFNVYFIFCNAQEKDEAPKSSELKVKNSSKNILLSAAETATTPIIFKCHELNDSAFVPDEWSDTIWYRTNFHFFKRKTPGKGPYDSVSLADAKILVNDFNYRFSNLQAPMLRTPFNPHLITNSKIRLKLCGYYEHKSDSAFMPGCYNGFDLYTKYNIGGDSIINVFFISEEAVGNGGHGTYGLPAYVHMNVTNSRYFFWAFLDLFVHEMGHSAGNLYHTDMAYEPDFVLENSLDPSKWGWIPCRKDTVGNNILGYNQCRMYLSPLQIGRWRREGTFGDRVRYTNFCTYDKKNTIIISKNETWTQQKAITGDVIVKAGACLVIKCSVHMAVGTKIIVEEGAKLLLEKATINSLCGSPWLGVEVWGNNKKPKIVDLNTGLCEFQGIVEVTAGSLISNAKVGISVGKRKGLKFVKGSGGGIVTVSDNQIGGNVKKMEYETVPKKK